MMRVLASLIAVAWLAITATLSGQVSRFTPVTTEMLVNPSPDDWLMYSRTYDAQRFSPLKQITRQNVGQLKTRVDARAGRDGERREHPARLPRRHVRRAAGRGRARPRRRRRGGSVWEYKRAGNAGPRRIAMYDDLVFYTAPDSTLVALDAPDGRRPLGNQDRRRRHVGADRGRGQGADGAHLLAAARELLRGGARREDREGGLEVLHRGRR